MHFPDTSAYGVQKPAVVADDQHRHISRLPLIQMLGKPVESPPHQDGWSAHPESADHDQ
jgi:hypothetical protein